MTLRGEGQPYHVLSSCSPTDLQHHIDPGLQAKQLQLRKSKLADTLNDKLANRPGPLQLLKNGIIEPQLSEVVKGYGELEQAVVVASSSSTSASSSSTLKENPGAEEGGKKHSFAGIPEIVALHSSTTGGPQPSQRHSIAGTSPSPADMFHSNSMDTSPGGSSSCELPLGGSRGESRKFSDSSTSPAPSPGSLLDNVRSPPEDLSQCSITSSSSPFPPQLRTSFSSGMLASVMAATTTAAAATAKAQAQSPGSMPRKKQQKKYRKLRYHEYVPPSKAAPKGGKTDPKPPSKTDTPYSSLLQQQQLFLQLQVLHDQYPNGILMQKLPDVINSLSKDQKALAIAAAKGRLSVTSPSDVTLGGGGGGKQVSIPQILPVETPNKHNTSSIRFEDLKVNDLKATCKERGVIVSGKKAELVERLMDHNKGLLPSSALPDNLVKDNRRQTFSVGHASSIDSQLSNPSSALSPTSPGASPVFKFPGNLESGSNSGTGMKQSGGRSGVQLAEVLPGSSLHKEFNEMIERQKRNYICQKGLSAEKSIAPRPELTDLLAIKLPSYPSTCSTAAPSSSISTSTSSSHILGNHHHHHHPHPHGGGQRLSRGGTLPGNTRNIESISQFIAASEQAASRSLPASPKPGSPAPMLELMDSSSPSDATAVIAGGHNNSSNGTSKSLASSSDTILSQQQHSLNSAQTAVITSGSSSTTNNSSQGGIQFSSINNSSSISLPSSVMASKSSGNNVFTSASYATPLQAKSSGMRPSRSSMPVHPGAGTGGQQQQQQHPPAMGPPSYNMVMRSRSIAGTHPNLSGLGGVQNPMNK